MKTKNRINIRIRKDYFLFIVSLVFLIWKPAIIKSETILYNTSYYPAPYGGYERLMTQGDTYLARSGSGIVSWGNSGLNKLKNDYGGSIELRSSDSNNTPGIYIDSYRIYQTKSDSHPVLSISSDFEIDKGTSSNVKKFAKLCKVIRYYEGANTYCGGNLTASKNYLLLGPAETSSSVLSVGSAFWDWILSYFPQIQRERGIAIPPSGNMVCCRIEVRR